MVFFKEKRDTMRMNVNCEIYCKQLGDEQSYQAVCITLSGSGISFISCHPFESGKLVEVNIYQETMPMMQFFITTVRCHPTDDGNFEIGAKLQLPEE